MQIRKIFTLCCLSLSLAFLGSKAAFAQTTENETLTNAPLQQTVKGLTVSEAWSRQTPKSAKVAGGYMRIVNDSDQDDVLLSASSPISGRIEIHEMAMDNGVMKMRQLEKGLKIPAKKEVVFKPGGLHIMFMDIRAPLVKGDSFPVVLQFKDRGSVPVLFKIEAMGALKPSK